MEDTRNCRGPAPVDARQPIWGVIGGMGPRASAEFLTTIYSYGAAMPEQAAPRVILLSDPSFPDRTECLLAGKRDLLIEPLERRLAQLRDLGATHTIICCMTMHELLPSLADRTGIISLLDVMLTAIIETDAPCLLLCTNGVRKCRLFENHRLWAAVRRNVILPEDQDQRAIHEMIYEIKIGKCTPAHSDYLTALRQRYRVRTLGAGCTEFHLLSRAMARSQAPKSFTWIDPLTLLAARIAAGRIDPQLSAA